MRICSWTRDGRVRCRMMDGHVSSVRVSPRRQRVVLDAVGPPTGRVEGRRDPAVASPAGRIATPAGAQAEIEMVRPGADRRTGRCDPQGTPRGIAVVGAPGDGGAVESCPAPPADGPPNPGRAALAGPPH